LTATTYLYDIEVTVSLTKFSGRQGKSETSTGGNATTMGNHVKERDGKICWVTGFANPVINSHICPKRMGDHLLRIIYEAFVSTPPPPTLSVFDEICGITLHMALDAWFDVYELGLRFIDLVRTSSFLIFYS
jgi:hypothetical protein